VAGPKKVMAPSWVLGACTQRVAVGGDSPPGCCLCCIQISNYRSVCLVFFLKIFLRFFRIGVGTLPDFRKPSVRESLRGQVTTRKPFTHSRMGAWYGPSAGTDRDPTGAPRPDTSGDRATAASVSPLLGHRGKTGGRQK
jgi:hypothetical protein